MLLEVVSNGSALLPVVAGLAVGIALVVLFSSIFSSSYSIVNDQNIKIRFHSMPGAFEVGSSVQPMIKISGVVTGCASPPYAEIRDTATNQEVWNSGFTLVLCDPDAGTRSVNIDWNIGVSYIENGNYHKHSNAMRAEKVGKYELTVQYAGVKETRTFEVLPGHVAIAYPNPQVTMKAYWVKEDGSTVEMVAGDNEMAHVKRGQDAVFDIEFVSYDNRTIDHWVQVYNADDPGSDFLLYARVNTHHDSRRLPEGMSYTLDDEIVSAKPMTTTTTRLVIHTTSDLPPGIYNIGVAGSVKVSTGNELESSSASHIYLPIEIV